MDIGITPGIGAITAAIIAAFVGFMSLVITKEQKLSEFRQAWIDGLRDDIADAISAASTLTVILQRPSDPPSEAMLREWGRFAASLSRIELRLNLKEEPHQCLNACIHEAQRLMRRMENYSEDYDQSEWEALQDRVVVISQQLLKIEWDIVKAGEPFYQGVKVTLIIALVIAIIGCLISFSCSSSRDRDSPLPAAIATSPPPKRV